ncbi:TRAFAC clade GTPase domain-containing protein [Alkalihalobacterium chitinilyticum]|uniref:Double-GTPase 2 domain-containing protein n=1 Tax=Alkalihalobacterium chitinilyticum TaxID=2980103 RepID=A0ABT5VIJ9_9BACI|nr:hypothetical protein [Alkalihalobacterium chitinilyticum]MDE5414059.1 hypothetical protein [Alkalihalobacterium chitinilyticum]
MVIDKVLKKDYICPYCFNRHKLHDVKFRCKSESEECIPEPDEIFSNFKGFNRPREMGHVFRTANQSGAFGNFIKGMPDDANCDQCGDNSTVRICPSCHSELPSTIGQYEDLIFAVIGVKETGKSHYISVLIDKIKREIGDSYECNLHPIDDETINRYRDDFWTPVFKKRETIHATRSGRSDEKVRRPLLYTLQFTKKNMLQKTVIHKVITLAFFDAAGEDLDQEDTMLTVNKYIYNSAGVILLLDPLQLDSVRNSLSDSTRLPNVNSDSSEILFRLTNLIRKAKNLKQNEKIQIPLAIAFSKIDAVQNILDPSSALNFPSYHTNGSFDLRDFENVHAEIETLVKEWTESGMTRSLETNYKNYGFFGLSSLGYNPDMDMKIKDFKPYRVEDPFLWLLYKHKIIKGTKRK